MAEAHIPKNYSDRKRERSENSVLTKSHTSIEAQDIFIENSQFDEELKPEKKKSHPV